MLSGLFDTRTMDRVNFMLRLSFISGQDARQVFLFQVAVKILVDQHHRAYATNAQAADGLERETTLWISLSGFKSQFLLECFPDFAPALHMAGSAFTELHHVPPVLFGREHVVERRQPVQPSFRDQ